MTPQFLVGDNQNEGAAIVVIGELIRQCGIAEHEVTLFEHCLVAILLDEQLAARLHMQEESMLIGARGCRFRAANGRTRSPAAS